MKKIIIIIIFAVLVLGACGSPQDSEFAALKKAADGGQASAQFEVGKYYESIDGGFENAAAYYKKAAEQGHVIAMEYIGHLCEAAGDYDAAVYWYTQAIGKGLVRARPDVSLTLQERIDRLEITE